MVHRTPESRALLQSLATSRALVDGNKRLALTGAIACLGVDGQRLELSNDQAYVLVMSVASGELDDVEEIAARLR